MAMKRIHVQFTEEEYAQIKSVGFLEEKSFSAVVRDGMGKYLKTKKPQTEKLALVLEKNDKALLKKILAENAYLSQEEFDSEHGFA